MAPTVFGMPMVAPSPAECMALGAARQAPSTWLAARTLGGSLVVASAVSYKGHRYPVEIISHRVWLYYRFALSLRDISEMMLERGGRSFPRDRAPMVRQVRPGLRQPAPPAAAPTGWQVACGRGVHPDQRTAPLPVARGR